MNTDWVGELRMARALIGLSLGLLLFAVGVFLCVDELQDLDTARLWLVPVALVPGSLFTLLGLMTLKGRAPGSA
jgi:predicted Kef-type K+ transport protein